MSEHFTEEQVVLAVTRLTHGMLTTFVEAEIVVPVQTGNGMAFRQIDLVRLELLCDLTEDLGLQPDALAVVMSLIDQLHTLRGELQAVLEAVAEEPQDLRDRIGAALLKAGGR